MDKENDKKIVRFSSRRKNEFFPPGTRIRSMRFYAPAIKLVDGSFASPWVDHDFEIPATLKKATDLIKEIINNVGIEGQMGDGYVFIPWPCAAIYFELVKN